MGCCGVEEKSGQKRERNQTFSKSTAREENKKQKENKLSYIPLKIDPKKKNEINEEIKFVSNEEMISFNNDALKENNKFRNLHGVNDLELDEYLYKRAFILANQYLNEGNFDNENLLYKNSEELGFNTFESEKELSPEELMKEWYAENADYNYQEPDMSKCTNFTQMIWKGSQKFGIGYYCKPEQQPENGNTSQKYFYSALYYPAGNKYEEYHENVLKKKEVLIQSEDNQNNEENKESKTQENGLNIEGDNDLENKNIKSQIVNKDKNQDFIKENEDNHQQGEGDKKDGEIKEEKENEGGKKEEENKGKENIEEGKKEEENKEKVNKDEGNNDADISFNKK